MFRKCTIGVLTLYLASCGSLLGSDLVPMPQKYDKNGQTFTLTPQTRIIFSAGLKQQADLLAAALSPATGWDFNLQEGESGGEGAIRLSLDTTSKMAPEAYTLLVENSGIQITAKSGAGIFYGVQTLLQLLPVEIFSPLRQKHVNWQVSGASIQDAPSYAWRGMMLDVSRYFFGKAYVLHFLDMMAMYKLNILHLHLIDDAGWRLEIKKYPKLTSVGAWRGKGAKRTGGYFTQEDIREIVAYAGARNIEVIPEIEVPAHTLPAIAAYPHLSCTAQQHDVQVQHSISRELYCVGKESTFEFLADVFAEVFELFPSKYVHIGGDEARYDRWKVCTLCQKRKKDLGLHEERELQVYFNQRLQKMVRTYGRTIVGWDEIIENGLTEKAVGMIWHNKKKGIKATQGGHDVVMALTDHCYFDVAESEIPGEVKAATWLKPISLEKAYAFNPMIDGIDEKYRPQVLGGQACLWSDQFIHGTILQEIAPINENRSEKYFDYLALPRMAALAEVLWSPREKQSWPGFEKRMQTHYNRYDQAGYGYRVPQPKVSSTTKTAGGFEISVESVVAGAEIRFTTDGLLPNVYSPIYTSPVTVEKLSHFQAITVVNRRHYSLPLKFPRQYDEFKSTLGTLVREWGPRNVRKQKNATLKMDVSAKLDGNGRYQLAFLCTGGENRLELSRVAVFKNNKQILVQEQTGFACENGAANVIKFAIDNYETGAVFTIKATVRGQKGNDSYGAVFIKRQ